MSSEGVVLLSRAALVIVLIAAASFFGALAGQSRRRRELMLLGTGGGLSFGIAVGSLMSYWRSLDVSAIAACFGIVAGWAVAWMFARRVPRDAD